MENKIKVGSWVKVNQKAVEEYPELLELSKEYRVVGMWRKNNKVKLKTYPALPCWVGMDNIVLDETN